MVMEFKRLSLKPTGSLLCPFINTDKGSFQVFFSCKIIAIKNLPGTGSQEEVGEGEGRGFSVNVPLLEGVTDEGYMQLFGPVLNEVRYLFSLIHYTIHILFQNIPKI